MTNPYNINVSRDVDNNGNRLNRIDTAPVVTGVKTSFAYSLGDSSFKHRFRAPIKIDGNPGNPAEAVHEVYLDGVIHYAVSTEVSLRMPFSSPNAVANPLAVSGGSQVSRAVRGEYDYIGMRKSDSDNRRGRLSLSDLQAVFTAGYTANTLPYLGNLAHARVSSGFKSTSYPYDYEGMWLFQWPDNSKTITDSKGKVFRGTDVLTGATFRKNISLLDEKFDSSDLYAGDYIQGWYPGWSLKQCTFAFSPATCTIDIDYIIVISSVGLYRMHTAAAPVDTKDIYGVTE